MRPLSVATRTQVLSLLSSGLSSRDIEHQTGVSKSTVSRIAKDYQPDKENHPGGCLRKLTPMDRKAVLSLVRTGKASTAVEAAKHINSIIPEPVAVQTIRNVLKDDSFNRILEHALQLH
ncbi:hypothetical protein M422DRAFT_251158 [Sphaerobolus stellatus SS14]|uniref:Uncharacterized protein n=1 Tax=Sphaerobolus stellatus (strain SS14) TaxID=990650 RepID=A0A0C9W1I6_SPHS4|nr:hypothetical protein M422DRAFT_251158 [Sphaerobolus stellatus SS14]